MRLAIFVFLLGFTALAAHAEPVYRSVMPDGRIIYGDKPVPGAKEAKEVILSKPNIIAPVSTKPPPAPKSKDPGKEPPADPVKAAQQRLDDAKAALAAGREEKEGDRVGTVGAGKKGMSQPNDAYYKRVKALEDAVAEAEKELDVARRAAR